MIRLKSVEGRKGLDRGSTILALNLKKKCHAGDNNTAQKDYIQHVISNARREYLFRATIYAKP